MSWRKEQLEATGRIERQAEFEAAHERRNEESRQGLAEEVAALKQNLETANRQLLFKPCQQELRNTQNQLNQNRTTIQFLHRERDEAREERDHLQAQLNNQRELTDSLRGETQVLGEELAKVYRLRARLRVAQDEAKKRAQYFLSQRDAHKDELDTALTSNQQLEAEVTVLKARLRAVLSSRAYHKDKAIALQAEIKRSDELYEENL